MRIWSAFLCALQLAFLSLNVSASAQDAPITDCDTYAASDQDPQHKGPGVPFDKINPSAAVPACESAVRQYPNSGRLLFQLGRAYHKANVVGAAFQQYRKAADQNYAAGQYGVGLMYANGLGVSQDYAQAVEWYRKAANQGYAWAQYNLGLMYEKGMGAPKDADQAVAWYRKAAEQGHMKAKEKLELGPLAAGKSWPNVDPGFLNAEIILEPGIGNGWHVADFLETMERTPLDNGKHPKVASITKRDNQYNVEIMTKGPFLFVFTHILSPPSGGKFAALSLLKSLDSGHDTSDQTQLQTILRPRS